jgi:hypothetical protein
MQKILKPPAHPLAALLSIGGMSLVVAGTLHQLGITRGIDRSALEWMKSSQMGGDFRDLPAVWGWLWTALISSFGLAAGMLISRRHWRRVVIWVSVLLLTLCWVPVLGLSGWKVPLALPMVAAVWCGLWAMIYAARHQEPGDA